jgi:hypothetical protein
MVTPTKSRRLKLYRFDHSTMVLASGNNHQGAVTIQAGEIVEIVGPAHDDRFVIAKVRGEEFLTFDCDLKDRGKPVPKRKPHPAAQAAARQ